MEQVRWPKGGLNVDDSIEILNPDDYFHAVNIADGRSYNGKGGEKENIRGTTLLDNVAIVITVTENETFTTWTNQGAGDSWTISATPSVTLNASESSKELNYLFSSAATGNIDLSFTYATDVTQGPITLFCVIKSGSTVVTTQSLVLTVNNGTAAFSFDTATPVDNISIYATTGVATLTNVNQWGNAGDYETDPSTWGYSYGSAGILTRDPTFKTKGNYSQKFTSTAATQGGFSALASAKALASIATVGKRFTIRANVYVPSSSPIAGSTFNVDLFADEFGILPPLPVQYNIVSQTSFTVAQCTNTWRTLELVIDITDNTYVQDFLVRVRAINPLNGFDPIINGGVIYVDEFYILEGIGIWPLTLSTPELTREQTISDLLDANSKLIGVIRSAKDDLNYLFFYNTDATKNCILKLENDIISLVLKWSGLNFSPLKAHRINGGGVTDRLVYFTDNYNQPRCVNLTRYASGAQPTNEEEILLIKRGPTYAPTATLTTGAFTDSPPLEDDYQFAIQYVYSDDQLSVLSPYTRTFKQVDSSEKNAVSVGLDAREQLPSLVTKVRYVVRRGNAGTPYIFDELDMPFDPLNTERARVYFNEPYGELIETIYNKAFESIPIRVGTMAVSKSRLWLGNYLEGYDTPTTATLTFALENVPGATLTQEGATWARNSRYRMGVVFYDSQGRASGVSDKGWVFDISAELWRTSFGDIGIRKRLKYKIAGTAPSWATHYSLVMSKDLTKSYFIEASGVSTSNIFVIENSDGTETYQTNYTDSATYIRLNLQSPNSHGIYYSAKAGDYAIIVPNKAGLIISNPLKVVKQVGRYVYVDAEDVGTTGDPFESMSYQIYTPAVSQDSLYWEVGEKRAVTGGTLDTTDYYLEGDAVSILSKSPTTIKSTQMNYYGNANWVQHSGKPFLRLDVGQVEKKTYFKCSSPFIANSDINGLSEFNIGDEGNVAFESGVIQKLQPTLKESVDGDVLLAICNSDTFSIYIDESRISSGDSSFLIASPNVIGDVRKQNSGYGTLHPESIHEEDGYVYGFDKLSRAYWRYATNGIFPISEYKMVDYFEDQSALNAEADAVVSGYDPFYKLIFVTFKNANSSSQKTAAFSILKERWVAWYDFAPDGYVIGSNKMYSVVNGSIYKHDNISTFNSFYGTTYNSSITLSFNDGPDAPKEWKVIQVQGSPNMYSFVNANQVIGTDILKAEISNRHGQATDIRYNEFEVDENMVYGEIRGDANSTGGVLNGDPIYSNTMQCKLIFSGGTYKQILMAKAGCEISRGHNL